MTTKVAHVPQHRWKRQAKRLIVITIVTYLGVCLLISALQAKLIYFPSRGYDSTPRGVGLDYESVTLTAADGVRLAAWFVHRSDAKGYIVFCHGNAGNIADRLASLKMLHQIGYATLIIDYRGYGESEGKPSEEGLYMDAEAAWRYLVDDRGIAADRVVLFGRSLGGAVAIELAKRHKPGALVVESTFTSLVDVARHHYRLLPVNLLLRHRYESITKVPNITCPKLFLHGSEDDLIPIELGKRLFEAAAEPKEFVATPGGHNEAGFSYSFEFLQQLADFLDRALAK
jgi:uncharacterized protein